MSGANDSGNVDQFLRAVVDLGKRIDALAAELAKLTGRIDRTLTVLSNEGTSIRQAHVKLEGTVKKAVKDAAHELATTDKMVEALDTKVRHLGDEVIGERAERIATSRPPPNNPSDPPTRKRQRRRK